MPQLNDLRFNELDGQMGTVSTTESDYMGILVYQATLPSGLSASDRMKVIIADSTGKAAKLLGIDPTVTAQKAMAQQLKRYFRKNPFGKIAVGYYTPPSGTPTFEEVETFQRATGGKCYAIGVYTPTLAYNDGYIDILQTQANKLKALHMPADLFYAPNLAGLADIMDIDDNQAKTCPNVYTLIGQDGAGESAALFDELGYSVPCLGDLLGRIATIQVGASFAEFDAAGNIADVENDVPAFSNGQLIKDFNDEELAEIQERRYIFMRKVYGLDGSYFNDNLSNYKDSDYSSHDRTGVVNDAHRLLYKALIRFVNGRVRPEPDGSLSSTRASALKTRADGVFEAMRQDGKISEFVTFIDPKRNVRASGIRVAGKCQPYMINRMIDFDFSFTQSTSS